VSGIFILILLVLLSSFFSLSETALTAINKIKVRKFLKQNIFGARALYELRENPGRMLSTILIGNNIVNIWAASLATSVVIEILAKKNITSENIAVGIATIIMTITILVIGEITPKTIAIRSADRISLFVAPIINILSAVFYPILTFMNFACKPLIKLFGGDTNVNIPFVTEEELKMLLSAGEEDGVLQQEEKEMIHSIFEFGDTVAKEVMVPKPDMFCLDVSTPAKEALVKICDEGHSRIPVYEGTIDNIIGLIYVKDLLHICVENGEFNLKTILHPALFIPETKKLDDLLRQMQSSRTHIAIVVDEYGSVAGLVTLEDLLEEIVGEIKDEFDIEEKNIEILADGTAIVDAKLTVKEVNEKIGTSIPEGNYDTIGGFVLSLIGKIPNTGDIVRFEDLRISVEKVLNRRITRIRIKRAGEKTAEGK